MKMQRTNLSTQILILILAAFIMLLMSQAARAQGSALLPSANTSNANSNLVAANGQQNSQNQNNQAQILQIGMPQKSIGRRLLDNTTLSYYQQFLGPTASGSLTETYNVFQEGIDQPGTGRAPLQSFHAANLRHQINNDWALGATLSMVNGYTDAVTNTSPQGDLVNDGSSSFFNARAYVSIPALRLDSGTLFTTISYEAPTSSISKEDDMKWGWVVSQSYAFNIPSHKWNIGMMGQVYRTYYKNNVKAPFAPGFAGTPLQTTIVSGGPYANYRFSDKWMLGTLLTLDWDQRGVQAGSREFNNNLPHRGRVSMNYFPKMKYVSSVGVFSQALLKFRPGTTAFGADFMLKF